MTDRGSEFFERYGIQNPIETTGSPKVINPDQGSGNSGPQLPLLDLQIAPPAAQVASQFLTVASGLILTSDAPKFEMHWLSRLLEVGGFC